MAARAEDEAYCEALDPREDEPTGGRLGRYVIDAWLASGGMADVYRARAIGAAGVVKELAIKRVSKQLLGTERALERFVTEARLSMQLGHANIVAVFDFGRADDGYYLAMEWIDGIDLASLLGRVGDPSPLPTAVVAHIGSQIARALQHAHEQLSGAIVHRDVKPSNVLLSRAGDVKLGDFGVAITVGDERNIAGTRGYMAPEQARGDAPDVRHDIFGLGKVLLEIAVGFRVEDADMPRRLGEIDPDLAEAIRAMVAIDPDERIASAQRAASALERVASRAIAGGDESPRDALVRLVANATAARAPSSESKPRPGRMESFALDATKRAIPLDSEALTHSRVGDLPGARDEARTRDVAPRTVPEPSSMTVEDAAPPAKRPAYAAYAVAAFFFVATLAFSVWPRARPASPQVRVPTTQQAAIAPTTSAPVLPVRPMPTVPDASVATATSVAPDASIVPRVRERVEPRVSSEARVAVRTDAPEPPPEAPAARGTLNIAARPWANVFVDGRAAGVTPVMGLSVSAGPHRVRFENDALGASRTVTVDVPASGLRNVSVTLD